jgi:hypothetical protein
MSVVDFGPPKTRDAYTTFWPSGPQNQQKPFVFCVERHLCDSVKMWLPRVGAMSPDESRPGQYERSVINSFGKRRACN